MATAHTPSVLAAAGLSGFSFTRIIMPSRGVAPVGAARRKYSALGSLLFHRIHHARMLLTANRNTPLPKTPSELLQGVPFLQRLQNLYFIDAALRSTLLSVLQTENMLGSGFCVVIR